jgi:spermidine/putrescine transport system permease protein
MSVQTAPSPERRASDLDDPAQAAPVRRRRIRLGDIFLRAYTWLIILWLVLPILVIAAFSFNDPKGRRNTVWQGFTIEHYGDAFARPELREALINSLLVALITMVAAGGLGTLVGLALGRYRFRGAGATNLVMFAVISSPELVMGASLLTLFLSAGVAPGFLTVTIAHIMFSISFVAVVVRARVLTMDRSIEEAARDLGATPFTTFRLVTLPMIFPAVLSGGLLAFALSIDDFVISNFTAGNQFQTLPLWIWGAQRLGLPPEVNVIGTLLFLAGVLIAVGSSIGARRRAR